MDAALNTRGRHALRWVLGVGLVFVVISAMGLQFARSRADDAWNEALARVQNSGWRLQKGWPYNTDGNFPMATPDVSGNYLRAARHGFILDSDCAIILTQTRTLFGSHFAAYVVGAYPGHGDALRDIFAAEGIELSVERADPAGPVGVGGWRIPRW